MALSDNLLAWYKLDETSGTNVADAASTNDMTNSGAAVNQTGKIGTAYTFATSDTLLVSGASTFDFDYNQAFSFHYWLKSSAGGYQFIYSKEDVPAVTYRGVLMLFNSGKLQIQIANEQISPPLYQINVATTGTYNDGTFKHVVFTYDGSGNASGVTIYVNGSGAATSTASDNLGTHTTSNTVTARFGYRKDNTYPFTGTMDEIGVWDKELTYAEVLELYNSGSGLSYPFTADITVTPSAQALSFSEKAPTINILYKVSASVDMTMSTYNPILYIPVASHVVEGTGTIGTATVREYLDSEDLISTRALIDDSKKTQNKLHIPGSVWAP